MKDQRKCEYVVLVYVPDPTRDGRLPVAVVARELVAGDARKVVLHVAAALQTIAKRGHLAYFHELFESWREVANDEVDRLFEEIRGLSSDLLRAERAGFCSIDDLPRVADDALRANRDLNQSRIRSRPGQPL